MVAAPKEYQELHQVDRVAHSLSGCQRLKVQVARDCTGRFGWRARWPPGGGGAQGRCLEVLHVFGDGLWTYP